MTKYLIILCLLFPITQTKLCAQEIVPSLELADFNFQIQNYNAALKEYLRLYYFDRDNEYSSITIKIADCFLLLNDTSNAIKYYQTFLAQSDSYSEEKQEVYYKLIQAFIQNKDYKNALAELFQCDSSIITADTDRYYYYMGMTYLLDAQLTKADDSFQQLSYYQLIDSVQYENATQKFNKNLKRKHLGAKIWSALLPGLGQTINNDPKDGLNSFAINGSMVLIFINVARSLSVADALLTVVPWFVRFYVGGIKKAGLASRKNQKNKSILHTKEIIEIVEKAAK